MDLKKN